MSLRSKAWQMRTSALSQLKIRVELKPVRRTSSPSVPEFVDGLEVRRTLILSCDKGLAFRHWHKIRFERIVIFHGDLWNVRHRQLWDSVAAACSVCLRKPTAVLMRDGWPEKLSNNQSGHRLNLDSSGVKAGASSLSRLSDRLGVLATTFGRREINRDRRAFGTKSISGIKPVHRIGIGTQ